MCGERQKEKGRLYTKQQSPNGAILFSAQYKGHIKIIQMIKKFTTDHISSLRQEEARSTSLLLLSTSKTPDERYGASIRKEGRLAGDLSTQGKVLGALPTFQ